ncbi:hypothetical protein POX_g09284 [Penicillium oxalicum]|uniref:Uncharacterized protein n=1 Tax=Penicillium oxalicum (strain 114-2 / CGMCC 5302) TaxID=933388 RepID=S7ZCJ0_PENO1|nr:hypothetical protein POX_g09284 [Penicillium oxalicum]EPS26416.1 hypothetical protein PDE_01352 [Penicillium oxalicum 114-2]KAI2786888.1 hypothetical protein POX_g09284 [Penicillium oxalicum]
MADSYLLHAILVFAVHFSMSNYISVQHGESGGSPSTRTAEAIETGVCHSPHRGLMNFLFLSESPPRCHLLLSPRPPIA